MDEQMLPEQHKGLLTEGLEDTAYWQKSPLVRGFMAGLRGALLGAGGGSLANAAHGGSALKGALIGGVGAGLLNGIATAISQDVDNKNFEGALRYHANRIKEREPLIFMPPPRVMGPIFTRMHQLEHRKPQLLLNRE